LRALGHPDTFSIVNVQDLIEDLMVKAYEEPLSNIRNLSRWPMLSDPLHLVILLIDFDTEVCMNGLLGFLENSTGAFLDETIQAFQHIGAQPTADILNRTREAMHRHGVSHHSLRAPLAQAQEFQITSFAQLHGPALRDFSAEVNQLSRALYLHDRSAQSPWPRIEEYLEPHLDRLQSELERIGVWQRP
jgi:hypothetical protein